MLHVHLRGINLETNCQLPYLKWKSNPFQEEVWTFCATLQPYQPLLIFFFQHNYPLVQKLIELGAKASAGKNKEGRQIVHLLAEQEDKLDLREMYPEETEVSHDWVI